MSKHLRLAAVLATPLLIWSLAVAQARLAPGQQPGPYAEWFRSQVIPESDPQAGMSCCDTADGHILEEEDWRIADGHYEIFVTDNWVQVPDSRVLPNTMNPTGKPVAWYLGTSAWTHVYCFAPGTTS